MLTFKYYYLLQFIFLTHMNASITTITLCNFFLLFFFRMEGSSFFFFSWVTFFTFVSQIFTFFLSDYLYIFQSEQT